MYTARDIFRKNWRLILILAGVIIALWLLYVLRSALLPFIFGLALAYFLLPVILWLEARLPRQGGRWQEAKRASLIILVFIVLLGLIGFFSYFIVTAVIGALSTIMQSAPAYIAASLGRLQQWAEAFRQQFPPEAQAQVDRFLMEAANMLGNAVRNVFTRSISFIPATFSLLFGFVSLPIFLFYIMKDSEKLKRGFYGAFSSPQTVEHARNIIAIIERVLGRYIRAQVMLGLVVGYFCFIGLLILRIDYAPALAAVAGITELIPILGPWIGGATAVIITLAIAPEKAIWVALLFFVVQLLENSLLVPRIQGGYLRIHPAIIMVLLVVGTYIAGFWGTLVIVPLTATVVEIYRYARDNIRAAGEKELNAE